MISLYFLLGMVTSFLLSVFLRYVCGVSITYSMLLSLTVGFFLAAVLEWAKIHQFFPDNSEEYRRVFQYFRQYWQLILINFLYTLGLFIHNFVFWGTDMAMHLVNTFVCNQPYDMATCLAMFTNISASVIFISRVEMYFHKRYRDYADAVFGGRGIDIRNTRQRMFRQLGSELVTLVRLQFIIYLIIAISNVAISIPLAAKWGAVGAAMGTAISLLVGNGLIMNIFYHKVLRINMKYFWKEITKTWKGFVFPALLAVFIMRYVRIDSLVLFVFSVIVFAAVYCVSVFLLSCNEEEKRMILSMVGRRRS